jgi:hypothetical protein
LLPPPPAAFEKLKPAGSGLQNIAGSSVAMLGTVSWAGGSRL